MAAPRGQLQAGNIDLHKRPVVHNKDGSISTVRSMSVNFDGQEVLIPTVSPDGKILSDEDAIQLYRKTGQHLGKFKSVRDADAYAEQLHNEQAKEYGVGVRVQVGKPSGVGVEVGTPSGVGVGIGPVTIDPKPSQDGKAMVPFTEFFKAIGGDKVRAEQMIPGITSPDGHKLCKPGPDGKPYVCVDPQHLPMLQAADAAKAQAGTQTWQQKRAEHASTAEARTLISQAQGLGGGSGTATPEWIPIDQMAQEQGYKSVADMGGPHIEALYPGFAQSGGEWQWQRGTANGGTMVRNPRSPTYKQEKLRILQVLAAGEEHRNELAARPPTANEQAGRRNTQVTPITTQQVVAEDGI